MSNTKTSYSLTLTTVPDGKVVTGTRFIPGATVFPNTSGRFEMSDDIIQFSIQKPGTQPFYRMSASELVEDGSVGGSRISPVSEWPTVNGFQSYTGPSSFVFEPLLRN